MKSLRTWITTCMVIFFSQARNASLYKPFCSAVIGWSSTALIAALGRKLSSAVCSTLLIVGIRASRISIYY